MRQVNKAIFLIKACSSDGTPLLLNYLSADWEISLFPNTNLPKLETQDIEILTNLLSARIDVPEEQMYLDFDRNDQSMRTSRAKETGDKEKREKYGPFAQYNSVYCKVRIDKVPEHLLQRTFEVKEVAYRWASLNALKSNRLIKKHNIDILEFLSASFDQTLKFLPYSFSQSIQDNLPRVFTSYAKEDADRVNVLVK